MFTRPRMLTVGAALLGAALVGAGGGAATYAAFSSSGSKTVVRQVTVADSQPTAAGTSLSVGQIYNRANKGVVEITATSAGQSTPFGGQGSQQAQGSGFVYDDSGHIVTNEHVVDGASSIHVTFSDGSTYSATVVGSDPSTDVAVLHVKHTGAVSISSDPSVSGLSKDGVGTDSGSLNSAALRGGFQRH